MTDMQQSSLFQYDEATSNGKHNNGASKSTRRSREPLSSKQQLSSTIKSVRDLLRKDAGLSGDTDRLPQLTWLLFLKSFDDFEYAREDELGEGYQPVIEKPYRWRDWAVSANKTDLLTGDMLLEFVNNELLPYLSSISSPHERDIRNIVGTIFRGTYNRI